MGNTVKDSKGELKSPIDYRIIGLIGGLAIAFQIFLYTYEHDYEAFEVSDLLILLAPLGCGVIGIIIAKRYWGSEVFGRSYFALGLAFLMYFLGDTTWIYYEFFLEEYPYPSIADVFYLAFSSFLIYYLITNIRYFKRHLEASKLILFGIVCSAIIVSYAYISFEDIEEVNFDFFFGLLYVVLAAVTLSLAILGAIIFRSSILGGVWLLLMIGLFIFTISDVWYYYLELLEEYDFTHPTTTLWMLSFMIIIYALYKHQKII